MNGWFGLKKEKEVQRHKAHADVPNWDLLSKTSVFSVNEVKRLYLRYSAICLEDGLISQARFMYMPELASCPFAAMAFGHEMELERIDHLGFSHFVRVLSKLSTKSSPVEKVEYFFNVLQIDDDEGGDRNLLEKAEVLVMYKHLLGGTFNHQALVKIVDQVWDSLTTDKVAAGHRHVDVVKGTVDGVDRAVVTTHLCSLDIQNFLTVQF
jgi:Ca2+-binding EF-hand superfamily protein